MRSTSGGLGEWNGESIGRKRPGKGFRIFIWSAVGFQALIMGALLVVSILTAPYTHDIQYSIPSMVLGTASILVFPAVGVIIFSRRPDHPVGWLFCVSQLGWAINNFANGFGMYALRARPDLIPVANWVVWFYTWPGYPSTAMYLFLVLLFPDGSLPSPRWKPAAWLIIAWTVVCMFASAFASGPVDASRVLLYNNPLGINGPLGNILWNINNDSQVFLLPLIALVGAALVLRFRHARGQTRQQLKWLAVAIVVIVLLVAQALVLFTIYQTAAVTPLWAGMLEQFAILSLTLIPITAAIAILRYRLYEIDRIINQALVYFSLTAALALVYFGCVVILQNLLSVVTGEGHSSIVTVLSTLAIAGLFTPLRGRFQRAIDQRFYRKKYNSQLILDRFSGVVRSEVDLQLLSDQLVGVIEETFQPEQTSLWLHQAKPDKRS